MSKEEPSPFTVNKEGLGNYPALTHLFQFFQPRTSSIVLWSFGFGFGGVETDVVESTGANIHIFDARPEAKERYDTALRVLTTHEVLPTDDEWVSTLKDKWVLKKRFNYHTELPWSFSGTIDLSGVNTTFQKINTETTPRVDLCKIDYPLLTYDIVHMLLNKGFRPGILYIRWDEHPDMSTQAMLSAGHLQNCGYTLVSEVDGYFLYRFIDECVYEYCSWARSDCVNPLVNDIRDQLCKPADQQ